MSSEAKTELTVEKAEPKEISIEVGPGEVGAMLELVLTDKDGKVVERRVMKSKSFVRQFLELMYVAGQQIDTIGYLWFTIKDITNTARNIAAASTLLTAVAAAGTSSRGIVLGTGDAAVTINDYQLQTQIAHGTGGGQLQYGGMTFAAPSATASTSQYMLTRPFSNGSAGDITVKEIGVYAGSNGYNFLIIRDVLSPTITVPVGQTLTINYVVLGNV